MKRILPVCLLVCLALVGVTPAMASRNAFSFGFIAHPFSNASADESDLLQTLAATEAENLAFLVVGGIKAAKETCSDSLYERRYSLLEEAKHGVIISIAASDWSDCRYSNGKSAAIERLNRIRELFLAHDISLGASKIPLIRQSVIPKFRDYAENSRWEIGDIMFATLHLPANNNRYLTAAGRNNEFEDRLIANRDWLQRIVMYAKSKHHAGIVIFSDGGLLDQTGQLKGQRDGYKETRDYLLGLAANFPGKILLIHNQSSPASRPARKKIHWQDNIGNLAVHSGWAHIAVSPSSTNVFKIIAAPDEKPARSKREVRPTLTERSSIE